MKKENIIVGALGICGLGAVLYRNLYKPKHVGLYKDSFKEIPNRPSAVSTQTAYENRRVEPLPFKCNLENSKKKIVKVLNCVGGIIVLRVEKNYIYAVATTPVLQYHDDIEFYFDEETKLIHYKSVSRVPYYDFGTNRHRYLKIKDYYFHLV
ncbi:MAG: DUF1499 domain-containing protein [Clostridium sp.]